MKFNYYNNYNMTTSEAVKQRILVFKIIIHYVNYQLFINFNISRS